MGDVYIAATDNTATINTKLALGGSITFEQATYDLTRYLDPVSNSRINLNGATLRRAAAATNTFGVFRLIGLDDIEIFGGTISGNQPNHGATDARMNITVESSSYVTIRDIRFTEIINDGIYVSYDQEAGSGDATTFLTVQNCRFIGTSVNRNGIGIIHANNILIANNHFYRMGTDSNSPGPIDLEPRDPGDLVRDVVIDGNTIFDLSTGTVLSAINIAGDNMRNIVVSNNTIAGGWARAMHVASAINNSGINIVIEGNTIRGNSATALPIGINLRAWNAVITGNAFYSIAGPGIRQREEGFAHIIGNQFNRCETYAIQQVNEGEPGVTCQAHIADNLIVDCGTNVATTHGGIHIISDKNVIIDNTITSSDASLTQTGVYIETGTLNVIDGNRILAANVNAINAAVAPQIIGKNIVAGAAANSYTGNYPPQAGTWAKGDIVYNPSPDPTEPIGWVCTTAGSPGTWMPFGAIGTADITADITLGPWVLAELPGTATTTLTLPYMKNTAEWRQGTSNSNDYHMAKGGRVIGAWLNSDDARLTGTATLRVRVSGNGTAFAAGACQLGASAARVISAFDFAGGVAFTAGQRLGVEVVTSGWTPNMANVRAHLLVRLTE